MAKSSLFRKPKEWIFETFKDDTSKMIIGTGTLGWIISSLAQIGAIAGNPKISSEKKSFLLPQELMDAAINVLGFFVITMLTKVGIKKMASTGKIAPQTVRDFLNKNKDLYKDKIGKIDFNLDEVLSKKPEYKDIYNSYKSYENFAATMGTIGASVLSCNIITPLIRNKTASRVQQTYIDMKNNPETYRNSGNMKI
jgi:hypothetical protein